MIYGYARVSTQGQARDGNSLEVQEELLRANGAEKIYFDAYTGTKSDRPEFEKLLGELKSGDTLLVTKVDRFTRNLRGGLELIDEMVKRGISVNILNMGMINNTPTGRLTLQIFMAFAEYERNMIVERTQEGKKVARKENPDFKEGRPAKEIKGLEETYEKVQLGKISVDEAIRILGIPKRTYYYRVKALQAGN